MAECIQGLVLLGNQQLLFVELGGFVNNAFFMSLSVRLLAGFPSQFLFVFFFFDGCLWFGVIRRIIVCQPPSSFISHVHRWTEGCMGALAANYVALVHGKRRAEGVYCQPFTPPPFM